MPKKFWQEPAEQWLGHFLLLGVGLAVLLGPFAIPLVLVREMSPWRGLPWPFKGQWPPGSPFLAVSVLNRNIPATQGAWVTRLSRVEDMRRDLLFTFAGIVIGLLIRGQL